MFAGIFSAHGIHGRLIAIQAMEEVKKIIEEILHGWDRACHAFVAAVGFANG